MKPIIIIVVGVIGFLFTLGFALCGVNEIEKYTYERTVPGGVVGCDGCLLQLKDENNNTWFYPALNTTVFLPGDTVVIMKEYNITCQNGYILWIEKKV